jgi:hypothetical protein
MGRLVGCGPDAGISGRRSPFRSELTISLEGATTDQTVAADTLMLMRIEMIATIRPHAINKQRKLLSLDETKPDICGDMTRSPSPNDE